MTYGTLVFGRTTYNADAVESNDSTVYLTEPEAEKYFERETRDGGSPEYKATLATLRQARQAFIASAKVRTSVEVHREMGGLRKTRVFVDEVRVGGQTYQVDSGTADDFIYEAARARYPEPKRPDPPNYVDWWMNNRTSHRTWKVEFVTTGGVENIELGRSLDSSWGFPIMRALAELERLQQDGWTLVHVSEDHGLYSGADAATEAYLSRVRYLLSR